MFDGFDVCGVYEWVLYDEWTVCYGVSGWDVCQCWAVCAVYDWLFGVYVDK